MSIKKKYDETDFKGGAAAAGESIKKTFNSIKDSEKTEKVISTTKKGFFSFVKKVKELMSDPEPQASVQPQPRPESQQNVEEKKEPPKVLPVIEAKAAEEVEEQPNLAGAYEDDDHDEIPKLGGSHYDDDEEEKGFGVPLAKVSKNSQEFGDVAYDKKQSWKLPDQAPAEEIPDLDELDR